MKVFDVVTEVIGDAESEAATMVNPPDFNLLKIRLRELESESALFTV